MDHDPHDLASLMERRRALKVLAGGAFGLGLVALGACGSNDDPSSSGSTSTTGSSSSSSSSSTTSGATTTDVEVVPEETGGPYPGDGTNWPNVLTESGIVRSDITTSFGSMSGTAEGVPVTVDLKVYDLNGAEVTALPGAALYLWHCTREGGYSLYSEGITDQNYLRGVQEAGADGSLSFTTIFPACYDGRWPHMHFEVYESLESATAGTGRLRTSQLAIPADVCEQVYGVAEGYDDSVATFERVSLDSDMVFSDGYSLQLASVTGSVEEGFTFALNVPV